MNLAQKTDNLTTSVPGGVGQPSYPSIYLNDEQAQEFAKEFPGAEPGKEFKAVICLKVCRASVSENGLDSLSLDVCSITPHADHKRPPQFEGIVGGILRGMKGEA